ncbi:methyltransferase domain-containing protein [Paraglaciecola sp.]|uniref:methyltransferase domain-containing protein n=1 Tax=Paraglaciecola sp. TaxID=1920173 RepID=UPI003264A3C2
MQIFRLPLDAHIVGRTLSNDEVASKLARVNKRILFVVEADFTFVGSITQGDLLAGKIDQESVTAGDVCNKQSIVLKASLSDQIISRFMTPIIKCIPLLNEKKQLVEIACLLETTEKVNLNVGAGGAPIDAFINLDVTSDWYNQHHQDLDFVEYDIRKDNLPYNDSTVDNIYCSHVIEHIENDAVERFLENSYRKLKPDGVLRIACPDAEFLYKTCLFDNDFWFWRRDWFRQNFPQKYLNNLTQRDFLIREISTPRVREDFVDQAKWTPDRMDEVLHELTQGLVFDLDNIGNHINFWTFNKLEKMGAKIGFKHIVDSKYQGSISQDMVGSQFDRTRPGMSMYVDFVR